MIRFILIAIAALITVTSPAAAEETRESPVHDVVIVPAGEDRMEATFHFSSDSPVWIFRRSAVTMNGEQPWRPQSWTVETPGVELRRIGQFDAFVASKGGPVPREVKVSFTPFAELLIADYSPAIRLSDGSVAYFSGHFDMRPAPSIKAVAALGKDYSVLPAYEGGPAEFIFRAASPDERFLYDGSRHEEVALDGAHYVIYGPVEPVVDENISAMIDDGVPAWLRGQLKADIPALMALYAQRLGERAGDRPSLLVSWKGPTPSMFSLGGSVINGMILMQMEGEGLIQESDVAYFQVRQFFAHEASHFWLGDTVRYEAPGEAWIMEGGSDLLAQRAAEILSPGYESREALNTALNNCAVLAKDGPLKTAPERNGQDAFYACGAIFSLVVEAAAKQHDGDFFAFWHRILDDRREEGFVTLSQWFDAARIAGVSEDAIRIMARFHETGPKDPAAELSALLGTVGIKTATGADGKLQFQ